ncbi:MAG: hypothetical protein GY749_16675, partial [Desulfobacteraceae bacterium]|nr:hypothetical protein [Desulfobacteraceae bacterium]
MKRNAKLFTVYSLLAIVCLVIIPVSSVWCKDKVSKPLQYSGYSSPEYTGYDVERQYVTMSDGVKLATVWYVP